MVLAIDNQISKRVVEKLQDRGYKVAIWAGDMPDDVWVEDALGLGADVFISPDLDIPNMLETLSPESKWIDVPQNLKKDKQFEYLLNKLRKLG